MLRKTPLRLLLFVAVVGTLAAVAFIVPQTAHAGGVVGGGGGSTGGCSSGSNNCPQTNNGYGWYKYSVNDQGPAAFRYGGSWASARQACIDTGNDSVIAFIIQTPNQSPSSAWVYPYVASDYGTYYNYFGNNGGKWLTYTTAKNLYDSLPGSLKIGWTWGQNVAWFCYNFSKDWSINGQSYIQVAANSGVAANRSKEVQGTASAAPGNRLYWWHDLRNVGPDPMDKQIYFQTNKSGFSNGWNGNVQPNGWVSGSAGALIMKNYAPGGAYTVYDISQSDVGNTLCQNVSWQPASSSNNGATASRSACASVPYNYTLSPTITNISNDTTMEGGVPNIPVNGLVTNNGPTKSQINIQWQVTKIIYKPGVVINNTGGGISSSDPCAYFAPASYGANATCSNSSSGTQAGGYANGAAVPYNTVDAAGLGDVPVGTHLCYAMSVKRNSSSSPDWRHSQLYCFIVGKKPKVQIFGSDLIVGAQASGSASAPTPSNVVTSSTTKTIAGTQKQYGSWVEYGMLVTGNVTGMASSAGYSGGANPGSLCSVSLLTFANQYNGSCSDTQIGKYALSGTSPQVASRFPVTTATPKLPGAADIDSLTSKTTYTTDPGATITLGATSPVPAGKWVVINAPTATIVITKNITYTSATLHSLSDIPQVVIIAKNIIVADSVTQIDSWLVAVGTGVDGRLNTCGAGTGITEATLPNANQCNQPLRVNGPVIVNHLFLRRTAGSGVGAASGDPSEVFNLRADAYLWSTSYSPGSARVPDASTKELPPRF